MRVTVIGFGNPLRTDDRFGLEVAGRLEKALDDLSDVAIFTCQQLLPEHCDFIKDTDWLMLIDASQDAPPAEIRIRRVLGSSANHLSPSHDLSAEALIGLTSALGCKPPHVLLITAGGNSFDAGEAMTPELNSLAERAATGLERRIRKLLSRPESEEDSRSFV